MKNIILALVETFDRHDYNDQKYYYSAAEALSDAREMAREKDPKIVKGYVQAWEIPFADDIEIPKNPENLMRFYIWNSKIVEDLTGEDEVKEAIPLAEILDEIHPIFCRSFDELAKEIVIDGGKYITAAEAIEKYGFEKVAKAAVEATCHGYETDVFEKLAEDSDGEDDDINGYPNCIARLASEKYSKQFYIDIIEDLASECLNKCFEL